MRTLLYRTYGKHCEQGLLGIAFHPGIVLQVGIQVGDEIPSGKRATG